MLRMIGDVEVNGIWDETLVPIAKDVTRWGLDRIKQGNLVENVINGAGEIAALLLG